MKMRILLPAVLLLLPSCGKNPVSVSNDGYRLPTSLFKGTLTGNELLFRSVESRDVEEVNGVFAADADGSNVRRLCNWESFGPSSPEFLEDRRVVSIKAVTGTTDERDGLVILDRGRTEPLEIDIDRGEHLVWCMPLRGPNADKIMYLIDPFKAYVHDMTTGRNTRFVTAAGDVQLPKPAPLADGRIAFPDNLNGGVQICNLEGTAEEVIELPEGDFGGTFFVLSDGRLLLAHQTGYVDYEFFVSKPGPAAPWDRVTGFPQAYPPQTTKFGAESGLRLFGADRLAWVHEDEYTEPDATFSVLVGTISGNVIRNAAPVFQSRIVSKKVSAGTAIYYLEWDISG